MLFQPNFHIPIIGRWDALGALQDFFALAVLTGIITFAIIRLRSEPKEYGRESRFYGSHTGGAWLILFMIFNVIWTYAIFRGASVNALGNEFPYGKRRLLLALHGQPAGTAGSTHQRDHRDRRADAAHRRHARLPADRVALQALTHLPGADQRHVQAAARRAGPAAAGRVRRQADRLRKPAATTPNSAAARSRTSPGRACSTSPPVPSAGAASRNARPGIPASRCRPSSSSWTCATTGWPRRPTSSARRPRSRWRVSTSRRSRKRATTCRSPASAGYPGTGPSRRPARWSAPPSRAA